MGRGKHQSSLELIQASYEILEEIQPATVRAVCYRLFVAKIIPDMSTRSTQRVSKQLTWARENDELPWEWIVDETRAAERYASWEDPQEFMNSVRRAYRKDLWADQMERVEVWSEKGTVRGTLGPVLSSMECHSAFSMVSAAQHLCMKQQRIVWISPSPFSMSGISIHQECTCLR